MTPSPILSSPPAFLSLDDYLAYDNDTETRYELVNGVLVNMPSESDLNNLVAMFLIAQLLQFVPVSLLRRGTEISVTGYRATVRIPDLMVLSEESAAALQGAKRSILLPDMPPPDLVVEVVSPGTENEQRDYRYKRSEYAARGIQEYWVVDPIAQRIMVFTWVAGMYEEATFTGNERILSERFPALNLTATQILQTQMDA